MSRHHVGMNTARWRTVRRRVLARANFRCATCNRPGRLEVDHVTPIDEGGEIWDERNMQALCRGCHIEKTRRERGRPSVAGIGAWRDRLREVDRGGTR